MTDKRRPTYLLKDVKELAEKRRYILTKKSRNTAHSSGFGDSDVGDVILSLTPNDFDKSTTENYHHQIWQDVYKTTINTVKLYIKFKITSDNQELVITSFKEDHDTLE